MNWPDLIIGALLGMVVPYLWSRLHASTMTWAKRRRWGQLNKNLELFNDLLGRLELVQLGWTDGAFQEDDVRITFEKEYRLPEIIRDTILEPSRSLWLEQGFRNNVQCGVASLSINRLTDDVVPSGSAHEIAITAHSYHYFELKATNFEWASSEGTNPLLARFANGARYDAPASSFPTPLSVGLSLFCEDGAYIILTRRTAMVAAGGHISPGRYFNAVGENLVPVDTLGELNGRTRLSIFRTASRGLLEEMGLDLRQVQNSEPTLHSLTWDPRFLDYKFFGYVTCHLSVQEVISQWKHAVDKAENRELEPVEIRDKKSVVDLVTRIAREEGWSAEARFCTIMSLMHLGRLTVTDLTLVPTRGDLFHPRRV